MRYATLPGENMRRKIGRDGIKRGFEGEENIQGATAVREMN